MIMPGAGENGHVYSSCILLRRVWNGPTLLEAASAISAKSFKNRHAL